MFLHCDHGPDVAKDTNIFPFSNYGHNRWSCCKKKNEFSNLSHFVLLSCCESHQKWRFFTLVAFRVWSRCRKSQMLWILKILSHFVQAKVIKNSVAFWPLTSRVSENLKKWYIFAQILSHFWHDRSRVLGNQPKWSIMVKLCTFLTRVFKFCRIFILLPKSPKICQFPNLVPFWPWPRVVVN